MRKLYSENQIKDKVLEVLNELGIWLNGDGKLEFNVPIKLDESVRFDGSTELTLPSAVYFEDGGLMTGKNFTNLEDGDIVITKYYE